MPLIPAKVIARIRSTASSDLGELTWEWVLRSDGQVSYRLAAVAGGREQHAWQRVARLSAGQLQVARNDRARAQALLTKLARQRGHQPG